MSFDILELDLPSPNMILDEVIPNLNMLCLEVLHWVERNLDGTCASKTSFGHGPKVKIFAVPYLLTQT